jgi:hypothetical protein
MRESVGREILVIATMFVLGPCRVGSSLLDTIPPPQHLTPENTADSDCTSSIFYCRLRPSYARPEASNDINILNAPCVLVSCFMEHQNGDTSRDSDAIFPPVEACSCANQNLYAPAVLFMCPSYLDRGTPHISGRACTFITFATVLIRTNAPHWTGFPLRYFLPVACDSSGSSSTLSGYSAGIFSLGVEFSCLLSCYSFPN